MPQKPTNYELDISNNLTVHLFNISRPNDIYIYIYLNKAIIGSDNDLSPVKGQSIILTNADLLTIGTLATSLSEIFMKMQTFSVRKIQFKMSAKWQPFGSHGNVSMQ